MLRCERALYLAICLSHRTVRRMLGFVDTCCPENTLWVAAGTTKADTLDNAAATRAHPRQRELLMTGAMVSTARMLLTTVSADSEFRDSFQALIGMSAS